MKIYYILQVISSFIPKYPFFHIFWIFLIAAHLFIFSCGDRESNNSTIQSTESEKNSADGVNKDKSDKSQNEIPDISIVDLKNLSPSELKLHLQSLKRIYQLKKSSYQKLKLTNELLCMNAIEYLKQCPIAHPLNADFFSKRDCPTYPLPTIAYHVQIQQAAGVQKTWKLIANTSYESSEFRSSQDIRFQKISSDDSIEDTSFSLLFRDILTLKIQSAEGDDKSTDIVSLNIIMGEHTLFTTDTNNLSTTANKRGIQINLTELQNKGTDSECNIPIQETLSRIEERVAQKMKQELSKQ